MLCHSFVSHKFYSMMQFIFDVFEMKSVDYMIFCILIHLGSCLVPPEYNIQLEVTETFIISDMFDSDDADSINDDDMSLIKKSQVNNIIKQGDKKKYYMLNQLAARKNREAAVRSSRITTDVIDVKRIDEYMYDFGDEPAKAQFLDMEEDKIDKRNTLLIASKARSKREDYNYDQLKHEYDDLAAKKAKSKDVLKYVDVTEKEGIKDAAKNIIKFKPSKNCTADEIKGIGANAARCYFKDFGKIKQKSKAERKKLLWRLLKMLLIWLGVYLVIAVPSWCIRGWCCCCCPCKYCKPRRIIEDAKEFLADNPVGVLHVDGKKVTYQPTLYEEYAQQRLEKVVLKL